MSKKQSQPASAAPASAAPASPPVVPVVPMTPLEMMEQMMRMQQQMQALNDKNAEREKAESERARAGSGQAAEEQPELPKFDSSKHGTLDHPWKMRWTVIAEADAKEFTATEKTKFEGADMNTKVRSLLHGSFSQRTPIHHAY